jgi:exonuclease III
VDTVRIAVWNSNGLNSHIGEISIFLKTNKIDILLISESHTIEQSVIKIQYYTIYYAHHPDGTAHVGSALVIKSQLKHHVLEPYITNTIQSIIIKLKSITRPITISAIYSPPRHTISCQEYEDFVL